MNILIVESAAKAKTLGRYLGSGWRVVATGGHVQTLPNDRTVHGKGAGQAYWSNKPDALPEPPWVWTDRGEEAFNGILKHATDDTTFWLATDPDREGEFIAWCLERLLAGRGRTPRVSFQEVTEEAVRAAIEQPRDVDMCMVESALLRMFLDRLVGFRTSKLARSVIPGGSASMGRVQTPTLGFVVDRELEREAHVPIPYFEVRARAATVDLQVRFHEPGEADAWKDDAGKHNPSRTFDGELAAAAEQAIRTAGNVELVEVTPGTRQANPKAPFSTDALLQAAGSRFGWSPKKTSALASMLYEGGHITYIRTDSTRLASLAIDAARAVIAERYGDDHLGVPDGTGPAAGKDKQGGIQDAHEAIRPTHLDQADVPLDDTDARKLYRLILAHTLASQMSPSRYGTVKIKASVASLDKPIVGSTSWRTFAGWEAAYAEFRNEPTSAPPPAPLEVGAKWRLDPETAELENPQLIKDETRPPPRYRAHSLIKLMKDSGIGRPSTYAKTVDKLEERKYVELEDGALAPTERGRAAWLDAAPLYRKDDDETELFSAAFTALMEGRLDEVAQNKASAPPVWEQWRDEIRDLHETARDRRNRGAAAPRMREQLERLMKNASPEVVASMDLDDLASLTDLETRERIKQLREAGVQPAPTGSQLTYIDNLLDQLDMTQAEAAELIDLEDFTQLRTGIQASGLIELLSNLRDERRPPSRKQLGLIGRLQKEVGLSDGGAAALVGEAGLDGLTGGREGSASALIDKLLALSKKKPSSDQQ